MFFAVPAQAATAGFGRYASGSFAGAGRLTGVGEKEQRKQLLQFPTTPIVLAVKKPRKPDSALALLELTVMPHPGVLIWAKNGTVSAFAAEVSNAKTQSPAPLEATALAATLEFPIPTIFKKNVGAV
jgi:hypothetical protein